MEFQTILTEETARRYKLEGWWRDRVLVECFDATVAATPTATAIVDPRGRRVTFAALDEESRRIASRFAALGVLKGDVISVQLPNWAEFASIQLAASRLGAVMNPLLPVYRESELSYILGFARSVIAIIPGFYRNWDYPAMYAKMWPKLPDLRQVFVVDGGGEPGRMRPYSDLCRDAAGWIPEARFSGDDVSALLFTSGTESKPKGVMHSHNTMMYATVAMARILELTREDVVWAPSPLGHGTGFLWGLHQALTLGAKLVLQDTWNPEEALRLIEVERCSYTLAATPYASMLLDSASSGKHDTSSLRYFGCAGAPVPRQLGTDMQNELGCLMIRMWGMTECFVGSASSPQDPEDRLWGTDGIAMPGAELAIFDDSRSRILPPGEAGELATRGPHVALGYLDNPECTADTFSPDGWLFTNDLATVDAEGYISIVGRKKDIINRGGFKISAREMEDFLFQHPLISAAAIVAVPDARLGERSCVFVVPKGSRAPTLSELIDFLEQRGVAKYKLPEYLVVSESFPMTPSGKIQKFMLRDGIAEGVYAVQGLHAGAGEPR